MAGTRRALLIATDVYTDPTFSRLRAPQHDANDLANVLSDKEIGDYQVDVRTNTPSHAVKDESGQLHLATTDTRRRLLAATAISAQFIRELIDHSPARRVVVMCRPSW